MSRGRANAAASRTPPAFNGGDKLKPTTSASPAHPMLGMQRAIGNAAAQAAMMPAEPRTDNPDYVYSSIPGEPNTPAPGYSFSPDLPKPSGSAAASSGPSAAAPASPAPAGRARSNATAASGPALPGLAMKDMNYGMTDFDTQVQRAGMAHAPLPSTTHYMKTEEARKDYARGFDKDGKMINKSTGSELNTIGAKAAPAHGSKPDRHIFTMDGKGRFHSADAIHETTSRGNAAKAEGKDTQERFHHSTFNAGQAVAGAGELQVRDGTVELVSDTSGHYHPGSQQMMQTVQQLEKNNVSMEKLGVEFSAKRGNAAMQASAIELLGYANHAPERAEEQMRARHAKKDQVLSELKTVGAGAAEGQNLSPSDVKKAKEEQRAAQAQAPAPAQPAAQGSVVYDYN